MSACVCVFFCGLDKSFEKIDDRICVLDDQIYSDFIVCLFVWFCVCVSVDHPVQYICNSTHFMKNTNVYYEELL